MMPTHMCRRALARVVAGAVMMAAASGVTAAQTPGADLVRISLEDIDRIEVIRGPGASVSGANAVNGVINIVTKSGTETRRARS